MNINYNNSDLISFAEYCKENFSENFKVESKYILKEWIPKRFNKDGKQYTLKEIGIGQKFFVEGLSREVYELVSISEEIVVYKHAIDEIIYTTNQFNLLVELF